MKPRTACNFCTKVSQMVVYAHVAKTCPEFMSLSHDSTRRGSQELREPLVYFILFYFSLLVSLSCQDRVSIASKIIILLLIPEGFFDSRGR